MKDGDVSFTFLDSRFKRDWCHSIPDPILKSVLFDLQFQILCYFFFFRKNYWVIWGALGVLISFNSSLLSIPSHFRRQKSESLSGEFSQKRETSVL